MLRGLPASIALHVCVIVGATASMPYIGRNDLPPPVIVPIELVTASSITDIAPVIEREAPPAEEPPPPPTEPDLQDFLEDVDTLPVDEPALKDEPAPVGTPPVEPEPTPEPAPPLPDETAEPEEAPEPKPEPEPKPAPPPDPLKDLLSGTRQRLEQSPQAPGKPQSEQERELTNETLAARRGAGARERALASYQNIIASQMKTCWGDVQDLPNPERLIVTLRVTLRIDGTLEREPDLIDPPRAPIGDRYMRVAIDRALRATRECAPYRLPREEYEDWKLLSFAIGPEAR